MKIVAVHGSARRNSSSIRAARDLVNELKSDDAEVKEYFTSDMNIKSCKCCFACRKKEICTIQNDDMDILYQDIITADLTVFSSPLFMGDVSGSFKLMLDRLYPPFFCDGPPGRYTPRHPGMKCVFVFAQGAPAMVTGSADKQIMRRLPVMGFDVLGILHETLTVNIDDLTESKLARKGMRFLKHWDQKKNRRKIAAIKKSWIG